MGVWIDYEGNETVTDPDTGEIIDDDEEESPRDVAKAIPTQPRRFR